MRFLTRTLSAAAVLATSLTVGLFTATPAHADDPNPFLPVTVSFEDSAHYVWTVPAGVYRVAVHLVGGSGGSGASNGSIQGGTGGYGGTVDAVLDVHPGQTLTADLGGRGHDADPSSALAALGGQQVLGLSGGTGGNGLTGFGSPISSGGGGGAVSTLVVGNVVQAIAGGGGGGGGAGGGIQYAAGGSGGATGQAGGGRGGGALSGSSGAGTDGGAPGSGFGSSVTTGGGGGGGGGLPAGRGGLAQDSGQGAGGGAGGGTFAILSGAALGTDTVREDGWVRFTPRPGLQAVPFFLTAGATSTAVHHSPLIISAAVISLVDGAPAPTGVVSFYDTVNGFLGTATIAGGRADLRIATLPVGTHSIVAHYAGDSTYLPADVPGTQTVTVTPAPGQPTPSASAIAFGSLEGTTTSATRSVTITNTGDDALTLQTATIAAPFAVNASDCVGKVLAAGQQCAVTASIRPSAIAPAQYSATLQLASAGTAVTIPVTATVIHRSIAVAPSTVGFGSLLVGTAASKTVTVTNTGTVAWTYIGATSSTSQAKVTGGSCVTGHGAAVGKSCTITLSFTPSAAGSRSATITVQGTSNASIRLTATGIAIRRTASVSPSSVSWSAIVGTTSTKTITVRNTGNVSWSITSRALSASGPLTIAGGTCTVGKTLAANVTCTVVVRYHPIAAGTRTVTLKIVDPAGTQQIPFTLRGIAVVKHLTATPSSVSFGTRNRGTTTTVTLTIRNTGNVSFVPGRPAVAAPFSIASTTCTSAVSPGKTCTIRLGFRPTAVGSRSATLVVPGSAPALHLKVTGTGR